MAATSPPIVLASQSPRRSQLMELIGLSFEVMPADLDETYLPHEAPPDHARRLAAEKAAAISALRPEALIVGSDTVVVVDGDVLGKPRDFEHALEMLTRLQGREHFVMTGIAVAYGNEGPRERERARERERIYPGHLLLPGLPEHVVSDVEVVRVRFRELDERTLREYIATGEPMDKAGAYGIQGYGATIVECIEGDYFAVMGLPIGRMIQLMREVGWRYDFRGLEAV